MRALFKKLGFNFEPLVSASGQTIRCESLDRDAVRNLLEVCASAHKQKNLDALAGVIHESAKLEFSAQSSGGASSSTVHTRDSYLGLMSVVFGTLEHQFIDFAYELESFIPAAGASRAELEFSSSIIESHGGVETVRHNKHTGQIALLDGHLFLTRLHTEEAMP